MDRVVIRIETWIKYRLISERSFHPFEEVEAVKSVDAPLVAVKRIGGRFHVTCGYTEPVVGQTEWIRRVDPHIANRALFAVNRCVVV